jgi:hypothetical protein
MILNRLRTENFSDRAAKTGHSGGRESLNEAVSNLW